LNAAVRRAGAEYAVEEAYSCDAYTCTSGSLLSGKVLPADTVPSDAMCCQVSHRLLQQQCKGSSSLTGTDAKRMLLFEKLQHVELLRNYNHCGLSWRLLRLGQS
jgi:hypothetical protein